MAEPWELANKIFLRISSRMSPGNLGDIGDIWGNFSRGWATSTGFRPTKNPFRLERLTGEKHVRLLRRFHLESTPVM